MNRRVISIVVIGASLLALGVLAATSGPVRADGDELEEPEDAIEYIHDQVGWAESQEFQLASGYDVFLSGGPSVAEAEAELWSVIAQIESVDSRATSNVAAAAALFPGSTLVQAAAESAHADLAGIKAAAIDHVESSYQEHAASTTTTTTTVASTTTTTVASTTTTTPPTTTTTTRPLVTTTTTTTTVAPTTTTTTVQPPPTTTTTTTLAPAAQLPPTEPRASEMAFMTELPLPLAVSADSAASSAAIAEDSHLAIVGFVRRVVDSQLPAGAASVAAGPLVVLGLIIDAVRSAGALMAVPWLLLGLYMAGLLREPRGASRAGG